MKIMKRAIRSVEKILEAVETAPLSLESFTFSFLALILVRLLVEAGVRGFATEGFAFWFFEFSHTLLFFLFAFLCFLPVARIAGASSWTRAANLLLLGFLIVWTPPILDKMIFGDRTFWSFYELDGVQGLIRRFFTFFGDTPDIGITYGVRIEVALMTTGMTLYSFFRKRKVLHALRTGLLTYLAFFILGTFPSYVAIPVVAVEKGLFGVSELDIARTTLAPTPFLGADPADPRMSLSLRMSIVYAILSLSAAALFLFRTDPKVFRALAGNLRVPQAVWHGGLFLLGAGFAVIFEDASLPSDFFEVAGMILLVIATESAWFASVIVNDFADRAIDRKTNRNRPLPAGTVPEPLYRNIGILAFASSLFFAGIVSMKAMLLLLAYQALAFLYSAPPFRLKRIPVVASLLSAVAGVVVLIAGFSALAPLSDLSPIPPAILVFLGIAYAATLPLKDFKDIEGDRKDGVYTLPVILGTERAKAGIGTALFLCYVVSPVILRELSLVVPALFFGTLSFFSVARAKKDDKTLLSFRSLPAIQIGIIVIYGFIVAAALLR